MDSKTKARWIALGDYVMAAIATTLVAACMFAFTVSIVAGISAM